MTKSELLERLWMETAALVATHWPDDHRGTGACLCSHCRVADTLRTLDSQFGMDLARIANERLKARRAANAGSKRAG